MNILLGKFLWEPPEKMFILFLVEIAFFYISFKAWVITLLFLYLIIYWGEMGRKGLQKVIGNPQ